MVGVRGYTVERDERVLWRRSGREKDLVTLFCGSSDDLCELLVRPVRVRAVMGLSRCRKVDALIGADITFEEVEGLRCQRSIFVEVG